VPPARASVDLYWIPLGAGGHVVRINGLVFEVLAAACRRRPRRALYHAALIVTLDGQEHAIELAPAWGSGAASPGVACTGAVGSSLLGRWRLFRYELRCRRGGSIPDLRYAVGGARRLSDDPAVARRLLAAVARVPAAVWGRDELGAGEMWNSNSVIAWLIAAAGIPTEAIEPPPGGRAPGWRAGVVVARRAAASPGRSARRDAGRRGPRGSRVRSRRP
jgi:hypothetical protein